LADEPGGQPCAAQRLRDWLESGILIRRPQEALFVFSQQYAVGGKVRCCRGLLGLSAPGTGPDAWLPIQQGPPPAEQPLGGPAAAPLLALHRTPADSLAPLLDLVTAGAPLLELEDDAGHVCRLWECADPAWARDLGCLLAAGPFLLADAWPRPATGEDGPRLLAVVASDEPGLATHPVHRLVRVADSFDFNRFFEALAADWEVYPLYGPEAIQGLLDKAAVDEVRIAMFIARPRRCLLMAPKDSMPLPEAPRSDPWRKLNASVLGGAVLGPLLGLDEAALTDPGHVVYCAGVDDAVARVQAGGPTQIAFLLNPVRAVVACGLAAAGEALPPATVGWMPRLPAGLLLQAE
ncbi:MAG: DUF1015 family protein, partial [Candidatus Riflebacteria bacterium]|nr:DUF1015 family protein [Candidatus Riflebacteria bacterium]